MTMVVDARACPGLPPITAAERAAERVQRSMALAARLGRAVAPLSASTPEIAVAAARSRPQRSVGTGGAAGATTSGAGGGSGAVARMVVPASPVPRWGAGRGEPLPDDLVTLLAAPPARPTDFPSGPEGEPREPSRAAILAATARHFALTREDLVSERRPKRITRPRHLAMWLMLVLTRSSLPQIGLSVGKRDHTTALHAARVTAARLDAGEADLVEAVFAITARLGARLPERYERALRGDGRVSEAATPPSSGPAEPDSAAAEAGCAP